MDINNLSNIIRLEKDEVSLNYKYWDSSSELTGIDICSYEYDLPILKEEYSFYPAESEPMLYDTYVKDPFGSKSLIKIESMKDYTLSAKCNCISNIAKILGATYFKFNIEVEGFEERCWDSQNEMSTKTIKLDLDIKNETENKLNRRFSDEREYSQGGIPTIKNYNEAVKMAKQYHLVADPKIIGILEQRDPNSSSNNMIKNWDLSFSLTQELNSNLDIAFKLNAMQGLFKLDSKFKETTKNRYSLVALLKLRF